MSDDVVVLNNNLSTLQTRTSKSGKQRFVVHIKSEPLVMDLSAKALGSMVSRAIADTLRAKVVAIGTTAAAATIDYRKRASKAFDKGARWAQKRYAGGKIGAMQPNQSRALFNDSSRFARSIAAGASEGAWTVNVAANRLDPSTAGPGAIERMFARLVSLVPEFGRPELLMQNEAVNQAVVKGVDAMIEKLALTADHISEMRARLLVERRKEILNLVKDVVELVAAG